MTNRSVPVHIPGRMVSGMFKKLLQTLQYQDVLLAQISCRAMKWRGFSQHPVHPKHLFDSQRGVFLRSVLKKGVRFLDVGCGVGTDCILANRTEAETMVGVDKNWRNLQTARSRFQEAGLETLLVQYDLETAGLPFPDRFFDVVNFTNVLEHLNSRVPVLRDIRNKLRENGCVVVSVPNTDTRWKRRLRASGLDSRDDADHKIEYTEQSLKTEFEAAGLKIDSPLHPIIPSLPVNGIVALTAAFSPKFYEKLQRVKRAWVLKRPNESMGWMFTAGRREDEAAGSEAVRKVDT